MAVSSALSGEVFSSALPTEDPVLYGTADLAPNGVFEARSLQTFTLTYRTGRYGLDDTGSIKIVYRFTADGGPLQTDDPTALNYVTAHTSNGVPLALSFSSNGHMRPWYQALTVHVRKGYLREGDTVTVVLGDTSGGSPGLRLQSMCETAFAYKVIADVCATGHYVPIAQSPTIQIAPGGPSVWKAIVPTLRRPGEAFRLGLKVEDMYGNPSDKCNTTVHLSSDRPVVGLPETATFTLGERSLIVENLTAESGPPITFTVADATGSVLTQSNPIAIEAGPYAGFWGDMHGQSGESVGINTAREYFTFARDLSFLDATSHQANDFQVNGAFWAHINELTAEFHEDHRFLTLPGYEWSGNSGVGGDRNVYFRTEGCTIRRSSHALIEDRVEILNDAPTARQLFEDLKDEDVVVYAHIGGRPADVAYAHDARLETAMEIHSAWGTFEWLMEDCFKEGYRVGVVANSDGHKGRPGSSYPGASQFGAYGGLTCFLMNQLTRDDWFECLRARRHYATTGDRILLDVSIDGSFERYSQDPLAYPEAQAAPASTLQMGDIASTTASEVPLAVSAHGRVPIERIDVLNGMEIIQTLRNPASLETGRSRVRILWRGANVKGRGAQTFWHGKASFSGCTVHEVTEINAWNPDRVLRKEAPGVYSWVSVTAGNFGAIDVWFDETEGAEVTIETEHVTATVALKDVGLEDMVIDAGGLDMELKLFRLPDTLADGLLGGSVSVPLKAGQDNPLWVRVTTEDGFQAWSSPIYLI